MSRPATLIPALTRDAWLVLAGDALSAVGSGLTLPFLFVYLHRVREIDIGVSGLAVATVALASLVGNPMGGSLSDRLGSRRTLMLGLVVSAAGAVSVTLVREPWHAIAATSLVGLGASVSWPALDALLATTVGEGRRSSAFAVRHAMLNAGFGVGAVAAAAIVDLASPGTFVLLYLLDAASFLAVIPLVAAVRAGTREARSDAVVGGYRAVLRDRVFVRVWLLTALLITVGYGQFHVAFPAYATGPGGISPKALSLAFAANTITVVAAQLVVLRILGGRRRAVAVALVCACWAATWGITLAAGGAEGGAIAVAGFVTAMIVFGVGETLLSPTVPAIVNDIAPDALRGRYNGAATLAWTTGFMVGPVVATAALAAELHAVLFVGLMVACGVAAIGALRLERHLPPGARLVDAEKPEPVAPCAPIPTPSAAGAAT